LAAGCGQFEKLKAKKNLKDAHAAYQLQDYRKAIDNYQEALAADDTVPAARFYLANSYDNLYKPSRQGEPENDAYLHKAVEFYQQAAEREEEPLLRKRALEFLVAAYGPDKLNDPEKAEPIVQRIIKMEPNEPTNYFVLAKLYEDAGRYDEAEQALMKAKEVRPQDPNVYGQLAAYYNRQGDFEKTIAALEERATREPTNPEAFYTISAYFEEKVRRDFTLPPDTKREYIMRGITAADKAISLNSDYMEALTYKNILLRQQANIEKDPAKQQALIREADRLRERAIELRKQRTAGVG
jgi:tetratricopeptide (TPR) repeat protein